MYVLVDCNNFFVSCERVFRPDLEGKPVVTLSNNDGCFVSRSNEAKALGIPMGAPFFKYEDVVKKHDVQVFSGNFRLYGDMSQRVIHTLAQFTPRLEVYSVDESFLDISGLKVGDYDGWADEVKGTVLKHTGIPVAVGIGATKTLAKASAELDKRLEGRQQRPISLSALKKLEVDDVWGVGRRLAPRLKGYGIHTAYDLAKSSPGWARKFASVNLERVIKELNGIDCFGEEIAYNQPAQKTVAATRSFGRAVSELYLLESAVASFVARATHKVRANKQLASEATVFLRTGIRDGKTKTFKNSAKLAIPTADTGEIIHQAVQVLGQIYQPGYAYKKTGVILSGLVPKAAQQTSLLAPKKERQFKKRERLMQSVDAVNKLYGAKTVKFALENIRTKQWYSKRNLSSPAYTTDWNQIPTVLAQQ